MTYNDYYTLQSTIRDNITKLEKQYDTVDKCYEKTQLNAVKVEREHIQEVINCLEEAFNALYYFTENEQ